MRPVNLIPAEHRRGDQAPARTGPVAYVLVGALVLALSGVSYLVLLGNHISEQKVQVSDLKAEVAAAGDRVDALSSYTRFREVRDARVATVSSLAESRFDWTRVMREFSRVLPDDVWLTDLTGTVRPDVTVENATEVGLRDSAPGPALEIVGCGLSQQSVAGFAAALRDIDGVTRVGVSSSKLPTVSDESSASGSAGAGSSSTEEDCQTRDFIAKFEIVAAFDAAPVPAGAVPAPGTAPAPSAPAPAAPAAGETETTPASTTSTSSGSG
jgi:Tfp pilus assembly protein PilN